METKFLKEKNYRNLCLIFSPSGLIEEGTILSGDKWIQILVYDVGRDFEQMFEIVD
jgi:hypothetical protein